MVKLLISIILIILFSFSFCFAKGNLETETLIPLQLEITETNIKLFLSTNNILYNIKIFINQNDPTKYDYFISANNEQVKEDFLDKLLNTLAKTNINIKINTPEYVQEFPMIELFLDLDNNKIYEIKIIIDKNHPLDYWYMYDPEGKFNNGQHLKGGQTLIPTYPTWPIIPEWKCIKCN